MTTIPRFENPIRKNIVMSERMYEESLKLAREEGVKYTQYVRNLIRDDIKRKKYPPEIPEDMSEEMRNYTFATNKRAELIKIMREMRRLL